MSEEGITEDPFDQFASSSGAKMFLVGEGVCLVFAFFYHRYLASQTTSDTVRHAVALVVGLGVGYLTYGSLFFHLILQAVLCYGTLVLFPANMVSIAMFVVAMGYLLYVHISQAFGEQEALYSIDVTGPLMIATQKITSLGFCISDGTLKDQQLPELRQKYLVLKRPSALQYFSYVFYFQGLLAGPFSFYGDYISYVEGTSYRCKDGQNNEKISDKRRDHDIPYRWVIQKLTIVFVCIFLQAVVVPKFDFELNIDPEFIRNNGIMYRTWYQWFSMFCFRLKYYIGFILGDAICNVSGFGFNGYDERGEEKWDLVTNVNMFEVELAGSPKHMMDNWNIQATIWLRHACFYRGNQQQRFATFVLSAVWHGVYPGYYFTFVLGGFFFEVVRQLRKKVRPYFLQPAYVKSMYDVMTMIFTQVAMSYSIGPFLLLTLNSTLLFYHSLYWWFHIAMVLLFVILPFVPNPPRVTTQHTKKE